MHHHYVKVQRHNIVYGLDALNEAVFDGWRYVDIGERTVKGHAFLVVKTVKRRVID